MLTDSLSIIQNQICRKVREVEYANHKQAYSGRQINVIIFFLATKLTQQALRKELHQAQLQLNAATSAKEDNGGSPALESEIAARRKLEEELLLYKQRTSSLEQEAKRLTLSLQQATKLLQKFTKLDLPNKGNQMNLLHSKIP